MLPRRLLPAVLAALLVTFGAGSPRAQDLSALLDRVDRMQRELTALQREVYRDDAAGGAGQPAGAGGATTGGAPAAGPIAARMNVRLTALESELANLTGVIEELRFRQSRLEERLDKLVGDVDFRLTQLEQRGGIAGAGAAAAPPADSPAPAAGAEVAAAPTEAPPPPPGMLSQAQFAAAQARAQQQTQAATDAPATQVAAAPVTQAPILPEGPPEERYKFAFGLLSKSDYDNAERALREFVASHGDHPLAGNAQYWLGETFYVRGRYNEAADAFLAGYRDYGDSTKAPDNLLKLGMTLARLDQKEQACRTLDRLTSEYPQAQPVIKQRAAKERQELDCPS